MIYLAKKDISQEQALTLEILTAETFVWSYTNYLAHKKFPPDPPIALTSSCASCIINLTVFFGVTDFFIQKKKKRQLLINHITQLPFEFLTLCIMFLLF